MTVGLSTTNEANAILDAIRAGGTNLTAPANLYVQLHTGDPGASGTSNISVGSTTRVAVTHAAASGGAIAMNGTAPSWTNGGTSETISHLSLWTATSGGTFRRSWALTSSKAWASGDTLTLTALGVSIAPLAA